MSNFASLIHSPASSMPSLLPWATRWSSSTRSFLHLRFLSVLLITANGCLSAGSSSQLAACNPVVVLPLTTSGRRIFFVLDDVPLMASTQFVWLRLNWRGIARVSLFASLLGARFSWFVAWLGFSRRASTLAEKRRPSEVQVCGWSSQS